LHKPTNPKICRVNYQNVHFIQIFTKTIAKMEKKVSKVTLCLIDFITKLKKRKLK